MNRQTARPGRAAVMAFAAACLASENAGAYGDGNNYNYSVHPGFTVGKLALGKNYSNMGLDWLSNGDLVMANCLSQGNYEGGGIPSPNAESGVYLVSNVTGSPTVKQIASNFRQPSGVVVVNDVIYVSDRDAFYKITSNSGSGSGNRTKVIDWPREDTQVNGGWQNGYWHQFVYCPSYYNGRFYAVYSGTIAGGPSDNPPTTSYSGAYLSWTADGAGGLQKYAGGFRSPNGGNLGPNGMLAVTDNQGSWMPSCPFMIIKPNKFYGHRQTEGNAPNWAQDAFLKGTMQYDPPAAWLFDGDYDGPGQSTTQPLYLDRGPYAGEWIVGDANAKGISRIILDPVNGGSGPTASYNGAVTYFTNGFGDMGAEAGLNRLTLHPKENIVYVGTIGFQGNWPVATAQPLFTIKFDEAAVKATFEIKAVRSRAQGVEVEFTNPINPSTATAGAFALTQYQLKRSDGYGAGNDQMAKPTISQVKVSNDNKRVFLQVGNQAGIDRVLKIVMPGVRSASGAALWFNQVFFTHNYQSTAAFEPTTGAAPRAADKYLENHLAFQALGGRLRVETTLHGEYALSLRSMNGARVEEKSGRGPAAFTFAPGRKGLHVLQVTQGKRSYARPVFL